MPELLQLDNESVHLFISGGGLYRHPLSRNPRVDLILDVPGSKMTIECPQIGPAIGASGFIHFSARTREMDGHEIALIEASVRGDWYSYYQFFETMALALLDGRPTREAFETAANNWSEVLRGESVFGMEKEIGLFGELLFAEHILESNSGFFDNWLGPASAEHDFVFDHFDIELKTTSGEERIHKIGSLSQLESLPNKRLLVGSIQITQGTSADRSLEQLVQDVRSKLPEAKKRLLELHLAGLGLGPQTQTSGNFWALRSTPKLYQVDDDFPMLTRDRLRLRADLLALISSVEYRVNLTNLVPVPVPEVIPGGFFHES